MSKLSTEEKKALDQILDVVETFTAIDQDMPIQMVRVFLLAAMNEGIGVVDLSTKAGQALSVTSRHVLDLGDINRIKQEGHLLLEQRLNPMDRRVRQISLTPKGRGFMHKLIRLIGRA